MIYYRISLYPYVNNTHLYLKEKKKQKFFNVSTKTKNFDLKTNKKSLIVINLNNQVKHIY